MRPLQIGILSCAPKTYSTRRLKDACLERGHKVRVYNTLKYSIILEKEQPELYYGSRRAPIPDAVIPRIGASITFFGLSVVRQFEQMGVYCANDSIPIARSRDKLRAMQILSRHDIGIPTTAFVRDRFEVLPAIDQVGGTPVIIKLLEGAQGVGVILAETVKMAEAIVQTLQSARQNVLIQKFVKESQGRDIRAFVVGDRVIAAMRRTAAHPDEFRSNVHLGGIATPVKLDAEYERTAIRASQILGLRIAGVDMLESNEGPQVMEVNSSPGLEGIESSTGIDIASEIIADIEQRVRFPEVDLKQKMRLAAGYVIGEITVRNMPEMEEKNLRELNLEDKGIHIISITRQKNLIPNPKGDEVIRKGDVLLCYGDTRELRKLIPDAPRKKRSKKKKARKRV